MVDLELKLPDHFLEEEERSGYVVSSEMKKIWAVELDLLYKLLSVCESHDIKIFASDGTLLGAVRHQGMIPWDDDIDLNMFREDYEKLCTIAKREFKEPYFFQTEYTDEGTLRGHAQLRNSNTLGILPSELHKAKFNQGIFIDIFPLDNVIDNELRLRFQRRTASIYKAAAYRLSLITNRYSLIEDKGLKKYFKFVAHKLFNNIIIRKRIEMKLYRKFELLCQKYNCRDTKVLSTLSFDLYNTDFYCMRDDLQEIIYVPFEFFLIPIPKNYDNILKHHYGDYMEFKKIAVGMDILFSMLINYIRNILLIIKNRLEEEA